MAIQLSYFLNENGLMGLRRGRTELGSIKMPGTIILLLQADALTSCLASIYLYVGNKRVNLELICLENNVVGLERKFKHKVTNLSFA